MATISISSLQAIFEEVLAQIQRMANSPFVAIAIAAIRELLQITPVLPTLADHLQAVPGPVTADVLRQILDKVIDEIESFSGGNQIVKIGLEALRLVIDHTALIDLLLSKLIQQNMVRPA